MATTDPQRHGTRAGALRILVALVAALLAFGALGAFPAPAHAADADGYQDFAGDVAFTVAPWDQVQNRYVPNPFASVTRPGEIRQTFDTAWSNLATTFCDQLETGIKDGDSDWVKRNHCNPTTAAEAQLRAKTLGTNLLGLRYFLPGNGRSIYAYDHDICFIFCVSENIDVSFDLTIDVVLRVAPGVGPETDASTPLTVQSARLSFSNARFSASVCTDSCSDAEKKLNATVVDIQDQVGVDGSNGDIHANVAQIPAYYGLSAAITATAASFQLNADVMPNLDPAKPVSHLSWNAGFGHLLFPAQSVWATDVSGQVWEQTSIFGLPYGHWFNHKKPTGTSAASGPAAVTGSDGARHVFVATANGHIVEWNGTAFVDRGLPPGTTAVGTPAAAVSGASPRVVVRGANGHVELLSRNSAGTYQWADLGLPGAALTSAPELVVVGGYTAVLATAPNGHVMVREALGSSFGAWRDLGAFGAAATTAPSAVYDGTRVRSFVTDANHQVEEASFAPFGAATRGTLPVFLFGTLPPVQSAPSVTLNNNVPTIFATDTSGNLVQFVWSTFRFFSGYSTTNYGFLLGATQVAAPTAVGGSTAFAIASNRHLAESHFSGTRPGLVDHNARSRVVYQAHAQDAGTVCCVSAGSTSARSSVILPIPPKWSTPVDEGQTVTSTGILQTFPDAFRVQSTIAGTVFCQANVSGLGWQPEVTDSQPCGSIDQKRPVFGIRFRLADTDSALHILYRCRVGNTWTKFVADGTPCGATGLNVGITAIQVQYSDAPLSGLTYRALSSSSSTMGPWVDEGATAGQPVTRLNAIQVHSNVGGLLRCQPNVGPDGWQNQVEDNKLCGSTDNSKHVDAFTLMLAGGPPGVVVQYRSKVSGQDWGPWVQNGQVSGSPDSGITLEQVQVRYVHTP